MAGDEGADRAELIELVARHAQLTDDGDWETRIDLYTEDGEFTSLDGVPRQGRDALREAFSATAGRITGKHITSNTVLHIDGDRAAGQTDFAFFMVTKDAVVPTAVGRYHDEFVRRPDGWRFQSRRIVPLVAPG